MGAIFSCNLQKENGVPLQLPIKEFLSFLNSNPTLRAKIAAPPNKSLLYAGDFFRPVWQELEQLRFTNTQIASKRLLPEVLASITTPGQAYPNLLSWAKALDHQNPWKENGFIVWKALSGIYASNAVGTVSFMIGSGVTKSDKVFAATELPVLIRKPNVDVLTKDILSYYHRCIQGGSNKLNFGFVAG
jgi:hypothetical protein